MSLYEKLQGDVKQAMLARDEVSRDTLRMLVAAVKKQELEQGKEITDELVMSILQGAAKTRAESIAQFTRSCGATCRSSSTKRRRARRWSR
jgi:uncharacterized protein YqeY